MLKSRLERGLGDVVIVLAFTGLRWEEAVAVPVGNVDPASQDRDHQEHLRPPVRPGQAAILDALNEAVSRLHAYEEAGDGGDAEVA